MKGEQIPEAMIQQQDIDHVYLTAVRLMTGSGGWPMNCIALPDGTPVFIPTGYDYSPAPYPAPVNWPLPALNQYGSVSDKIL